MQRTYEMFKEEDVHARVHQSAAFMTRAIRCLDLSKVDPKLINEFGERRAVMLMEILDRIELPASETIPNEEQANQQELLRWRIPETEIVIERIAAGPRQGEFLFAADTVRRIPEFYDLVKHLPYREGTVLPGAFVALFDLAPPSLEKATPLKPADTSSPHATLKTFLDNMNTLYEAFKTHGLSPGSAPQRREASSRALRTLDLSDVPSNAVDQVAKETAVLLMEVLDRIEIPPAERIPDATTAERMGLTSWTIPDTQITIARVESGPRQGEFLFTSETIKKTDEYYVLVKHLPYNDGTVLEDAYHVYLQAPGPMIPVSWILDMPPWLKQIKLGQPLWKWFAVIIMLLLLAAGLVLSFRIGSRRHESDPRAPFYKRVLFPIGGLFLAWLTELAVDQIQPGQGVVVFTSVLTTLLASFSLLWFIVIASHAISESIVATPRIDSKGIDAQLVRLVFRVVNLVAFVLIILYTASNLGFPLTPVLAGLGVGGLAVALATQNSLEDLIGGINLFMDRPIRVGELCRFGDRIGRVEEIGLRSTRVRSFNDTVITIPNSAFSKMELENFARRRKIWYHPRIQLAKDITADQVRYVLVEVRKVLYAHPKVDPNPARVRFAEFGAYSLDLDIFAYVDVTEFGEFLGVAEDLNLRIMDIVKEAGASLAVPIQRTFIERAATPEEDLAEQTEQTVQQWRENDQLYLPSFSESAVAELRNTLDFPPKGAPNKGRDDPQNNGRC
ncbi:mechanosensitive ion channel family protein [Novipirellula maiorica]|nr:mechanosensitive ion channel family protein [Rhodopirellula maiorica]